MDIGVGPEWPTLTATGAAAFLNTVSGYRPGYEMYLLVRRVTVRREAG
jgi:hypothetical protein